MNRPKVAGHYILEPDTANLGAEVTIAAMSDSQRREMGRKTMNFVWSIKRNNPGLWAEIQRRAKEQEIGT